MNNIEQLFLVRHAESERAGENPSLSSSGKKQAERLGWRINKQINNPEAAIIWTSSAARAVETARIIKEYLPQAELVTFPHLWADNKHTKDFPWLKAQLDAFKGKTLVVVTHLDYVNEFPMQLGLPRQYAEYAQGVLVENNTCTFLS